MRLQAILASEKQPAPRHGLPIRSAESKTVPRPPPVRSDPSKANWTKSAIPRAIPTARSELPYRPCCHQIDLSNGNSITAHDSPIIRKHNSHYPHLDVLSI